MDESSHSQRLLSDAHQGQPSAVNALLDHHRPALRAMVRARLDRALARRVDASDIVQDVLLEASQRLPDYLREPRMPFPLWLRQLALDRIIDTHRRHRVAARRSLDREQSLAPAYGDQSSLQLAQQLKDSQLTPAAATIRHELERRFVAALDDLDEEDREIIVLRHFEHLSNSEAADFLGLSPPAAGMRHLRAIRRLRAILGESPSRER